MSIRMTPQAVDLGLSSRWCTCNLGAESPEQYGDYFAWGEIETKSVFESKNYKWVVDGEVSKHGKVVDDFSSPSIRGVLDINEDVVHHKLGGSWHIPHFNDIIELYERCSWKWTSYKGVKGYRLTSKINGYTESSIFLPAAGLFLGSQIINKGYAGYYWTSALYRLNSEKALSSVFDSNIIIRCLPNVRFAGLCIRPVCD